MIVETYLDTSSLNQNQVLAIVDDAGKRWDVSDALESSADSSPRNGDGRGSEVVLERWTVTLGDASGYPRSELEDPLANVYKKGVVLFRSLFTPSPLFAGVEAVSSAWETDWQSADPEITISNP